MVVNKQDVIDFFREMRTEYGFKHVNQAPDIDAEFKARFADVNQTQLDTVISVVKAVSKRSAFRTVLIDDTMFTKIKKNEMNPMGVLAALLHNLTHLIQMRRDGVKQWYRDYANDVEKRIEYEVEAWGTRIELMNMYSQFYDQSDNQVGTIDDYDLRAKAIGMELDYAALGNEELIVTALKAVSQRSSDSEPFAKWKSFLDAR